MLTRVISGIVGSAVLIGVLLGGVTVIEIAVVAVSVWCLMEAFSAFSYHRYPICVILAILMCFFVPFFGCFSLPRLTGILFGLILFLTAVMVLQFGTIHFRDIAVMFLLLTVIPVSFATLIYLRKIPDFGVYYLWLPFIGAFMSDIFAFFVGGALKGPKLCKLLSPKKTVSGSIGGLVGSVIGFFVFSLVLWYGFHISVYPVPYYSLAVATAVTGQLGDLFASSIKRSVDLKDFGNVIPGHGGMLDRMDSVLFAGPTVYIFLVTFGLEIMR